MRRQARGTPAIPWLLTLVAELLLRAAAGGRLGVGVAAQTVRIARSRRPKSPEMRIQRRRRVTSRRMAVRPKEGECPCVLTAPRPRRCPALDGRTPGSEAPLPPSPDREMEVAGSMDFKEACHRLRMTPTLLKWFTRYSPKGDGRKLQQKAPGEFDVAELETFDAYLRSEWTSRRVPVGIEAELFVEACGHCGLCGNPCDKLEMAHIQRRGIEVEYYFQHPGNLIPLCGSCHNRYDAPELKSVTFEVIQVAKDRLTSRKMESIDRDVERAKAVRAAVEAAKVELTAELSYLKGTTPSNQFLWTAGAADLLSAAAQGVFGDPRAMPGLDPSSPSESLKSMRSSIKSMRSSVGAEGRITQAVLDGYAQEAIGAVSVAPPEWEMIEYRPLDDGTMRAYERGYEHLPEVGGEQIDFAQKRLDGFGDEWWDSDEGREAFALLDDAIRAAQIKQFNEVFLPTLPEDVRRRRSDLISSVHSLLASCRSCRSWRERSEYKLPQWLDHVPESMVPYTSMPNLVRIEQSLGRYLSVHKKMDDHQDCDWQNLEGSRE